jgi:hypothetical protein
MKRKVVLSRNEYAKFVNAQNNRTNVYTTVYDFEHFSETAKIESSVILDRIFLDFDGHDNDLELAWRDLKMIMQKVIENDWKHTIFFSGRGFHLFLFGEPTDSIRDIQTFFRGMKEVLKQAFSGKNTLDDRVGQPTRLRRVPNTVNMSSSDKEGNPYYCIPLIKEDLSFNLEHILELATKPRLLPFQMGGNKKVVFPKAPPIDKVEGEISVAKYTGKLPILPCLHSAIMTENPSHMARAYLVSWYRDLLTGRRPINSLNEKQEVLDLVVAEIKQLVENNDEIWLDWDEATTRKHAKFTVFGNYKTPFCNKLISDGYCVGKCWRYPDYLGE